MKTPPLQLLALALFACLALSAGTVQAQEPFPTTHCIAHGASPVALGVSLAYGLVLGERMQNDEMSQDDFREALMRFQDVTRLMLVDQEPEAACQLLSDLEHEYDLPRPDLNALPGAPAPLPTSEED